MEGMECSGKFKLYGEVILTGLEKSTHPSTAG